MNLYLIVLISFIAGVVFQAIVNRGKLKRITGNILNELEQLQSLYKREKGTMLQDCYKLALGLMGKFDSNASGYPELVEFPEQTCIIAKDQPEYRPMPAHIAKDAEGTVTFCWELTDDQIVTLLMTRKLWHQVLTHGKNLQPQLIMVHKPELK